MEIWKDTPSMEDRYQVSNLGRVRSKDRHVNNNGTSVLRKGKILSTYVNNYGYEGIKLTLESGKPSKTFYVHKLVAVSFLGNCKDREPNHIDGNKLNNNLSNIEWLTHSDNIKHAFSTGLISNYARVELKYCEVCSNEFKPDKSYSKFCSQNCYNKSTRIVERPSKEQLLSLVISNSFEEVGRLYNVKANTIKKWCKVEGLPHLRSELNKL